MFTSSVLVKQNVILQKNNFHMPINRLNTTHKSYQFSYITVMNKWKQGIFSMKTLIQLNTHQKHWLENQKQIPEAQTYIYSHKHDKRISALNWHCLDNKDRYC